MFYVQVYLCFMWLQKQIFHLNNKVEDYILMQLQFLHCGIVKKSIVQAMQTAFRGNLSECLKMQKLK